MTALTFHTVPKCDSDESYSRTLFGHAWDEFVELQVTERELWISKAIQVVESRARYEIGMKDGDKVVGGIVLALDDDPHVGECLTVVAQYVLPEYRHKGVSAKSMRECLSVAKMLGHTVLAYTHRVRDWTYLTRYKEIK